MKLLLQRLLVEEDGPTAVEYAVMLSLIIVACVGGIQLVGQATGNSFTDSSNQIAAAFGLDFYHTQATGSKRFQCFVVAERWNVNSMLAGGFQNGAPRFGLYSLMVNG